jgi:hypothetical protein
MRKGIEAGEAYAILLIVFVVVVSIICGTAYIEAAEKEASKYQCTLETYPTALPVDTEAVEIPIYVVLKEPILVNLETCQNGNCTNVGETGMIYKIRAGTTDITDRGMVNIIPYHKEARELLGNHLRIPMINIKCIVTGENKIKGSMWE